MNLDFAVVAHSLAYLWKGMQYTLQLTATSAVGGLFFGTLLALARLSSIKLVSNVAAGYVNLMRSIPLVLVIFWFFFLVPLILQGMTCAERPPQVGAERTAIITFIMFEAAYFFEAFTAATLIYITIAMTANRVMAYVERRVAVPGYIGGGK